MTTVMAIVATCAWCDHDDPSLGGTVDGRCAWCDHDDPLMRGGAVTTTTAVSAMEAAVSALEALRAARFVLRACNERVKEALAQILPEAKAYFDVEAGVRPYEYEIHEALYAAAEHHGYWDLFSDQGEYEWAELLQAVVDAKRAR